MAHFHATNSGLRIIESSAAEAELYEQTDLGGVDPQEWQQSYPLILVSMPGCPLLIGVLSVPECRLLWIAWPINLVAYPVMGLIHHAYIGQDVEKALSDPMDRGQEGDFHLGPRWTNRTQCSLHLANYPDFYGRFSPHTQSSHSRQARQWPDGKT